MAQMPNLLGKNIPSYECVGPTGIGANGVPRMLTFASAAPDGSEPLIFITCKASFGKFTDGKVQKLAVWDGSDPTDASVPNYVRPARRHVRITQANVSDDQLFGLAGYTFLS